jgi:hypothetical protein
MYFRMAGGWTSIAPREFQSWPIVNALLYRSYIPGITDQLMAFLAHHDVSTVIIADRERALWEPLLAPLHPTPIETGGVALYHFAPADLAPWRGVTSLEMDRRCEAPRFDALLGAAPKSLAGGADIDRPASRGLLGLLPAHSTNEAAVHPAMGLSWCARRGLVGVGVSDRSMRCVRSSRSTAATRPDLFSLPA